MLETIQSIFKQIQLNVCENPDVTAFAVIVSLFLYFIFAIIYFSLKIKNSKLRKENVKLKSKFSGLEFNLNSECADNIELSMLNLELEDRISELFLEKQYLESDVFKKYDKIFKAAGLISDEKIIQKQKLRAIKEGIAG